MTKYVAGFLFSPRLDRLVLISKKKPAWQNGKLNAIGGKIEENESEENAMVREFKEETGLDIYGQLWHKFVTIGTNDYSVTFFYGISDEYNSVKTMEEEEIIIIDTDSLHTYKTIDNLSWLVPLALDKINSYSGNITIHQTPSFELL